MQLKIVKWGNSLGLRIPRAFAEEAGVEAGSEVNLSLRDGELVVRALRPNKRYRLSDLLEEVTPDNLHEEVDFGSAVGSEAW